MGVLELLNLLTGSVQAANAGFSRQGKAAVAGPRTSGTNPKREESSFLEDSSLFRGHLQATIDRSRLEDQ
uniref:Uncharacterized protein n=1 Tax=Solanum tuberosum TaxID=4113 RepID=M1DBY4_SOLTU